MKITMKENRNKRSYIQAECHNRPTDLYLLHWIIGANQ